jgi:hypothetical protein
MANKGAEELLLSASELALFFKVTRKTIAEWVKIGMPKRSYNVYSSADCLQWWQENIDSAQNGGKAGSARDRYWLAKAESEEIKVSKHKGELAPIAEFEKNEAHRMASLRGSLMALPGRLALALEMKDRESIRETIKREVWAMLENFQRNKSYLADGCAPMYDEGEEVAKPVKVAKRKKPAKKKAKK